jgi:hypothetical protein
MANKLSIIQKNAPRYRASNKKTKGQLASELAVILNMNRRYLALLLRSAGRTVYAPDGRAIVADATVSRIHLRGRKKTYHPDALLPILTWLWRCLRFAATPILIAFIRLNWDKLRKHPKLQAMSPDTQRQLRTISPATAERLLRPVRKHCALDDHYSGPRPVTSLKHQIPVETYHDKPKEQFGYLEADLVHHSGGSPQGEFAYSMVITEITTGWSEVRALRNRAQRWAMEALSHVFCVLPFKPTGLHTDNGSEFINHHLVAFARHCRIPFTRSRDFQKNDAPYVESKNWSLVRGYSGYRRYDTAEETKVLSYLNELVSVKHNYFMPTMKIRERHRVGPRVIKRYDIDTPLNRVLNRPEVPGTIKQQLREWCQETDLFWLLAEVDRVERLLDRAHRRKYSSRLTTTEEQTKWNPKS